MRSNKILVTGGAGYIGSHACKALAQAGYEPVTYDNLSTGHKWAVKWGPLVVGDVTDRPLLVRTLKHYEIGAVMHFAGSAYVGESMRDPVKYFTNNTLGSLALLDSIMNAGVRHIVFSSSCVTYGHPARTPIDESHPTLPVSPYGDSKLVVEKALKWFGELKGLQWTALRYFNAAGADPEGEAGAIHDPETRLIPLALKAAAPGDYHLQVYGTDYPTEDGTAVRDYVHVADLADAHVLALRVLENSTINDAINLGTGRGASVKQVIETIEKTTGLCVRHAHGTRRAGDPAELVADPSRARTLLSWTPQRSDLDTIVADAWRWHQKVERSGAQHKLLHLRSRSPAVGRSGWIWARFAGSRDYKRAQVVAAKPDRQDN